MPLPKRPAPYLLTLLLLILVVLAAWMFHVLTSPEVQKAVAQKKSERPAPVADNGAPLPSPTTGQGNVNAAPVDAEHQRMADELNSPDNPPLRDLEILQGFLSIYGRAFREGMPIGDNADITAALTGKANTTRPGKLFPDMHRTIRNGQLTDRWGEPYWFHPNSGNQMEIRSGGPDKRLFTEDDIVLNPSPAGLGVTPPSSGGAP